MTLRMDADAKQRTYKIGQAATLLDVKPFVLRFWESEFKDALVPVRTPSGQRAYTEANVATVREIKRLLYDEGLTIEGAKKRLGQPRQGEPPQAFPRAAPSDPLPLLAAPSAPSAPSAAEPALARAESARAEAQADAARAVQLSETLAATLREAARELTAIRDLLT